MNRFILVVGDWSQDGHNRYNEFIVESNFTLDEIRQAHTNLKDKGIDLTSECEDYEQNKFTDEFRSILTELNIDLARDCGAFEYKGQCYLDARVWSRVYLELAKKELPNLIYEFVNFPSENIGGYGLYLD